jgi:hypothetical protein
MPDDPKILQAATAGTMDERPRLDFDDSTRTIYLDGTAFEHIDPLAYKRFKLINAATLEGRRIPDSELPGKGRVRRHFKNHLPRELFALLDRKGNKGGGSCLNLPLKSPR